MANVLEWQSGTPQHLCDTAAIDPCCGAPGFCLLWDGGPICGLRELQPRYAMEQLQMAYFADLDEVASASMRSQGGVVLRMDHGLKNRKRVRQDGEKAFEGTLTVMNEHGWLLLVCHGGTGLSDYKPSLMLLRDRIKGLNQVRPWLPGGSSCYVTAQHCDGVGYAGRCAMTRVVPGFSPPQTVRLIYVDNSHVVTQLLQEIFGRAVEVKEDLYHVFARVDDVLPDAHPCKGTVCSGMAKTCAVQGVQANEHSSSGLQGSSCSTFARHSSTTTRLTWRR